MQSIDCIQTRAVSSYFFWPINLKSIQSPCIIAPKQLEPYMMSGNTRLFRGLACAMSENQVSTLRFRITESSFAQTTQNERNV